MIRIMDAEDNWHEMLGILDHQIEFFEAGNMLAPKGQNPAKATAIWLEKPRKLREDYDVYIAQHRKFS